MLEPMAAFFDRRLAHYDAHMREDIEGAREFYPFTAAQLPLTPGCRVLKRWGATVTLKAVASTSSI